MPLLCYWGVARTNVKPPSPYYCRAAQGDALAVHSPALDVGAREDSWDRTQCISLP